MGQKNKNILCTICARGGSKGVLNKNIKKILEKPLISYTINQANESGIFNHIVVSTDSDEIASISKDYGAEIIFKRPSYLATDDSGKLDVIKHALIKSEEYYKKEFDYIIDLDATSPLRLVSDIKNAYSIFLENNYDNLFSVMKARRSPYFNLVELDENNHVFLSKKLEKPIVRRQDSPKCFDMNASIYIWKREVLLTNSTLFLEKTGIYIMPEDRSLDIDSETDFEIVEYLLKKNELKK
ncbi:MAG: acylneuraminate cytidylyltransferase family protein [Spirochaetia bacterium]|nr:acylneuraminate cytidylyltransferase family protein [Spirochaetia bacterium]